MGAIRGAVPVVDLRAREFDDPTVRREVAHTLDEVCRDLGFLVVHNHGVPDAVIDAMCTASHAFFGLPDDVKAQWAPPSPYVFRGFFGIRRSALAGSLGVETPPDLCEVFAINRFDDPAEAAAAGLRDGRESFFAPNVWPDVAGFRNAWTAYYAAMEELATRLMQLMALALDLDEHWFDGKIAHHISNLVANHYPSQPEPPAPGQLRRGAHTDYGSLTILYQDDNPGGLQVQRPDGGWVDVPPLDGSFVVNLGDLMAAWTNDRWVSTMHRVVNPAREVADRDRLSIAFFHQPDYDASIECIPTCADASNPPRYAPVTSGQWVLDKLTKSVN
jgi:isopenicillin N synthase-like dioxygenase